MAATGTRTETRTGPEGADGVIKAITDLGGIVIWEMNGFCSVFVSNDEAPRLAPLKWEDTVPGVVTCFYVPEERRWVVRDLRAVLGHNKLIFTQELQ
jgi:hypothetical protein